MSNTDKYEIVHVIDLTGTGESDFALITYYNEASSLEAVGSVQHLVDVDGKTRSRTYLGANFQLNAMWISDSGNLWVVDDQGDVFTTAKVSFSQPPYRLLKYNAGSFDIDWQVTEAFKGQLNGIWGTTDNDVWVTSFKGPALHWNGKDWTEYTLPQAPNAIDGSASDDIYIVGYHGNIHHFDGNHWRKVTLPANIPQQDAFTDVKVVSKHLVYITGRSGCLLVGNAADGFKDIGSPKYSWYGVGTLAERVFLAGGEAGIFELIDTQVVQLTANGQPVGVFETPNAINFIPAEQQPNPWFVRYEPGAAREWTKVNT
ncbi:hypothetical protein [Rheinheimera sp. MMS21-TC3]|uniref:hypothetical protein n=1 Tax=Rheinheimera sp. MMS21-TC3 TaxID=3072790 RepID=UPI0028C3D7F6|nr:hypothetical protein [Rheinheimera sp. MMS21-TC3]WNO60346.1 hypothetical protein RDV63_05115 [Rheinheimera sp. MMS21-TC3]